MAYKLKSYRMFFLGQNFVSGLLSVGLSTTAIIDDLGGYFFGSFRDRPVVAICHPLVAIVKQEAQLPQRN